MGCWTRARWPSSSSTRTGCCSRPATPRARTASWGARAFFYAGARSVLASHWAVASRATVALTTGAFDALAKDASLGRAEALRRSALKLAGEKDTGHPFFWAPFVLVGDGGAPSRP